MSTRMVNSLDSTNSTATGAASSKIPFGHRWSIASHIEDLTPDKWNDAWASCPAKAARASLADG
jgi:hypothetical protein